MAGSRAASPGARAVRPITPELVVARALDVADADGLRAVTLGRVARELGCHVTSLYTHVESIDDLYRRMAVAVLDEIADELERATDGRHGDDALLAIARVHRAFAGRHPGRVQAMHAAAGGPEDALAVAGRRAAAPVRAALAGYGLSEVQVRDAHRIFSSMTRGFVQSEAAGVFADADGDPEAGFADLVALFLLGLRSSAWPTRRG